MSSRRCGLCGKDPAEGFASVDGTFYCHGDFDPDPTCYMRAQGAGALDGFLDIVDAYPPDDPKPSPYTRGLMLATKNERTEDTPERPI